MNKLGEKGQSTIEYILLLIVVISLGVALMNSPAFKKFVGKDSELMQKMVRQMSYAYRHGRIGEEDNSDYTRSHETYYNKEADTSRFFAPITPYP